MRRWPPIAAWAAAGLLLWAPAALAAGEAGQEAFMQGLAREYAPSTSPDYPGAGAAYGQAAREGSREALLALSRLKGPGQPLWAGAAAWRDSLVAAAGAGWAEAALALAQAIENKTVAAGGLNPAVYYYQAAAAGLGPAALRLGELYLADGPGRNEKQGALWLAVAAENHEPGAALALGRLYRESDPQLAARWLEKADSAEGGELLGELYLRDGRFIEAVSAFTAAADRGSAPAHLQLGLLALESQYGRRPNPREALRHFKIAAQNELPEGAYQLAQMYLKGQGTPKDAIVGAFWLAKAAKLGHAGAGGEYNRLTYNFSAGQKKRLERMIEEGAVPAMQTTVQ